MARSTYYRWRKQRGILSNKDSRDQAIGEACAAHKYRYGYRKIATLFPEIAKKKKTLKSDAKI
ncbi:hypothetical protein ACQKEY_00470 [Lysinibacillus fusiformis]|uniref:hypothetical protein n=1 Tax=Lysinibacillus fusiformis TaxID=28031 RepID=UPI003D011B13